MKRTFVSASWDAWRATCEGASGIARRQHARLNELVAYARTNSSYFADLYRQLPDQITAVEQLPPLTKADLMAHFDAWVTDPAITRQEVEAFVADTSLVGQDYPGRYVVCTTSGSTGTPALLLHDQGALAVYNVLGYVRSLPVFFSSPGTLWALLRGGSRLASIFVSGGHFLGATMSARRARKMPWRAKRQRTFSALTPLHELVAELNAFQPVMLGGYPSALDLLAKEQESGRLQIHPVVVNAAGETLETAVRQHIKTVLGCRVGNYYGSSEAVGLTYECRHERLHVNTDWYLLEPVAASYHPVPHGQASHSVLVTNLANRVQPIIRYELGDRVTIQAERCPCGSPFPVIEVIGRTDDILHFPRQGGGMVHLLPLALVTVAEETPGVYSCQLIQAATRALTVRLSVTNQAEKQHV
jgi:phenylacetate-coenzyme A ligase PaaK-like adenylate-forming protein